MIYWISLIVLTILVFRHVHTAHAELVQSIKEGYGNLTALEAVDRLKWAKILIGIVATLEILGAFFV